LCKLHPQRVIKINDHCPCCVKAQLNETKNALNTLNEPCLCYIFVCKECGKFYHNVCGDIEDQQALMNENIVWDKTTMEKYTKKDNIIHSPTKSFVESFLIICEKLGKDHDSNEDLDSYSECPELKQLEKYIITQMNICLMDPQYYENMVYEYDPQNDSFYSADDAFSSNNSEDLFSQLNCDSD
jgi:hypothetical protein